MGTIFVNSEIYSMFALAHTSAFFFGRENKYYGTFESIWESYMDISLSIDIHVWCHVYLEVYVDHDDMLLKKALEIVFQVYIHYFKLDHIIKLNFPRSFLQKDR